MAKTFKTDAAGKALIKEFEKCELETYFDATSGNPVIGWGQENWLFPNTPGAIRVVPGLKITQQQADDAFEFFIHNVTDPLVWLAAFMLAASALWLGERMFREMSPAFTDVL
jgi:GH24 family phage-related lysozyme (muramidase)